MIADALATTTAAPDKVLFSARQFGATTPLPLIDISGTVAGAAPLSTRTIQIGSSAPGRANFRLTISQEDGLWIVTDLPTGIYGCGETVVDALADFRHAMREHLDVLERQPALAEPLRHQLAYLRARIV